MLKTSASWRLHDDRGELIVDEYLSAVLKQFPEADTLGFEYEVGDEKRSVTIIHRKDSFYLNVMAANFELSYFFNFKNIKASYRDILIYGDEKNGVLSHFNKRILRQRLIVDEWASAHTRNSVSLVFYVESTGKPSKTFSNLLEFSYEGYR
jgi:hypothetical protein